METYVPPHCPPHDAESYVTESDSSITLRTQRGSFILIQTRTHSLNKNDLIAKTNTGLPLPTGRYFYNVQSEDGPHNVASFFTKPPYRIKTSIGVASNAILTVPSFFNTGPGPNLIVMDFLLPAWKQSVKSTRSLQLLTANCKVVNIEGKVPLFIHNRDLRVRAWFGMV